LIIKNKKIKKLKMKFYVKIFKARFRNAPPSFVLYQNNVIYYKFMQHHKFYKIHKFNVNLKFIS